MRCEADSRFGSGTQEEGACVDGDRVGDGDGASWRAACSAAAESGASAGPKPSPPCSVTTLTEIEGRPCAWLACRGPTEIIGWDVTRARDRCCHGEVIGRPGYDSIRAGGEWHMEAGAGGEPGGVFGPPRAFWGECMRTEAFAGGDDTRTPIVRKPAPGGMKLPEPCWSWITDCDRPRVLGPPGRPHGFSCRADCERPSARSVTLLGARVFSSALLFWACSRAVAEAAAGAVTPAGVSLPVGDEAHCLMGDRTRTVTDPPPSMGVAAPEAARCTDGDLPGPTSARAASARAASAKVVGAGASTFTDEGGMTGTEGVCVPPPGAGALFAAAGDCVPLSASFFGSCAQGAAAFCGFEGGAETEAGPGSSPAHSARAAAAGARSCDAG
mmetsp:Transcript_33239/g.72539  ORF Transcript_33239/g.72539 Transcript_33239/m.72539 type:complete len:385 (-) Transcript_33239:55-1209(-)